MKKISILILSVLFSVTGLFAQTAYNPFTQNINFQPEPTVQGFQCGSTPNVEFTMGMTTAADATMWQTDPLKVTICITGFVFDGATAASVVSGSYSTNFNWAFDSFSPNCIIGTQNQTLPGTGTNPLFPNPASTGDINLALEVPSTSPTSTILAVNVNLQVPGYMSQFNSTPDDNESTQTQTFCPCDSLTSPGSIASPQAFCTSGNPAAFTSTAVASGGNGGVIEYQWQSSLDNVTWTNISGSTMPTYDAPSITATTFYRRAAKRSFCPNFIYTTPIEVTINNPLTSPGTVGSPQNFCDSGDPATLTNTTSPSGGNGGAIVYQWQISSDNTSWTNIAGATSATYNPPTVSATTYYRRAAKRDVCGNDIFSNSVEVTIQPGVDAGTDGNTTVCENSSATIDLSTLITGEDAGGTWARTSGTGGTFNAAAGTFVPAVGATTSTFTYTVAGTAPCPNDNSVATVNIQALVDAGMDGNTTVCESNTATIDLTTLITGEDAGGTWARTSGTGGTFSAAAGTYVSAVGATTSTFTYTVAGTAPCPNDNSVATVNIQAGVDAGMDGNTTVCESNTATIDLTTLITGEDAGGTWARTSGTGGTFSAAAGTYVPAVGATTSTFTYTVAGTAPCPNDNSVATVNIQPGVDAGVDGNTAVCDYDNATIDLTTLITGEDAGGTWVRSSGTGGTFNAAAGTYVPAVGATTSTFTYTVAGTAPCPSDNSVATVTINICNVMVSGNVFEDNNGPTNVDGMGTNTNTPIFANLVDPSGNVVSVVPVASDGSYTFPNVTPNTTYTMILSTTQGTVGNPAPLPSLPAGWENVSEDCCDNMGNDGTTDGATTVTVGTVNVPEVNFGITQPLSLGNLVWNDLNQDGNFDAGEPFIQGATVNLYADANNDGTPDGAAINTATTLANGEYRFDDLMPGNYIVGVTPPAPASGPAFESTDGPAQSATPNDNINNDDNGVTTVGGETISGTVALLAGSEPTNDDTYAGVPDANSNLSVDFGFFQPIKVTGNVYSDQNGPTDVDGTPINAPNNVPLYANLVDPIGNVVDTDPINPNGTYEFDDVEPNTTYTVVLSTTQGTVGNPAPVPNLPFGWNNVSEDCCDNMGNDGTTDGIVTVIVVTDDVPEANFGINEPLSLGNTVWNDLDQNGVQDPGELGILGATVNLYEDANNDGTPDGAAIQTQMTDVNGLYLFDDLLPGSYLVGVTPPTPATGSNYVSSDGAGEETDPNLGGDKNDNGIVTMAGETLSGTVALAIGTEPTGESPSNDNTKPDANSNLTVDFGFFQPINIEGTVFNDQDGPTNIDGTPINNPSNTPIYVSLVDPSGNVVGVDTVDPNGEYDFMDVEPNTVYTIVLSDTPGTVGTPAPTPNLPAGWDNVGEDCCDGVGNDGTPDGLLTVTVGTSDIEDADYGIFEPLSIGNQVWIDSNKNGILDMGELPLSNAVVNLYEDVNNDGTPDGAAISTVTTGTDGLYKFEDLQAGNYIVGVTPPMATGGSYTSSQIGDEVDPNLDVDLNDNGVTLIGMESRSGTLMLMAGTEPTGETPNNTPAITDANSNLTVDFGFFLCPDDFTFADVPLCATTSIDLTSYELAEYTGGAWTFNNQPVANPSAVTTAGTYTYTFTNGTCAATGDLDIFTNIPDYTPTIQIAPSAITGASQVRVILTISEILDFEACSDLFILVPKLLPRFIFNYQNTASIVGGIAVNNADWQYFPNANPNFYIWKYTATGAVFPALGSSKIGYIGTYDPNNTDGQSTFSVQVFQGSGGETNQVNNTDSDLLIYFR